MRGAVDRLVEIYRKEGPVRLLVTVLAHVRETAVDRYWDVRGGTQSFAIAGATATFEATTDRGGGQVRWGVEHEREMLADFVRRLRPDDVVFDVGANVGLYSCFAGRRLADGRVVAFEPYRPNVEQIERNASLNDHPVDVVEVALSDSSGPIELDRPRSDRVGGGTASISRDPSAETFPAEVVRGDDLVSGGELPRPTVVKIDVEGAEGLVVEGLRESLASDHCRLLYCEVHLPSVRRSSIDDFGSTVEEFFETVRSLGFTVDVMAERPYELHVRARKS